MKVQVRLGCCVGLLLCFAISPLGEAQTFTTLVNFSGSNGANPLFAPLVQGTDGNLYSTTYNGGLEGYGTAFKITSGGMLTTLHVFDDNTEGRAVTSGLVQASDGN